MKSVLVLFLIFYFVTCFFVCFGFNMFLKNFIELKYRNSSQLPEINDKQKHNMYYCIVLIFKIKSKIILIPKIKIKICSIKYFEAEMEDDKNNVLSFEIWKEL